MIGFISTLKGVIYLKNKSIPFEEKDFAGFFLQENYPDIKLWFTDALKMTDITKYKLNTNHCASLVMVGVWDVFSVFGKLDAQTIINLYSEIDKFHPRIQSITNKESFTNIWDFDVQPLNCELPEGVKCNHSTSKTLSANIDVMEFLLWLAQQDVILPKGSPTESKMKLKTLLSDENRFNLSIFVKREQIERLFKDIPHLTNNHWTGDWISATWLKAALYNDVEHSLEKEFDVMVYEEVQPVSHLMPTNFNLSWLFCPSAHYVFFHWLIFIIKKQKSDPVRFQLLTYLIGLFVFQKFSLLDRSAFMTAEFDFFKWQSKDIGKRSSNVKLSARYTG
jgi:hypothetical protein